MNNSKLVNILRTFSGSEMKEFERLAASPFFNKGRNYVPFLKELNKFHPKFDNEKMTAEYLFGKIYPSKKYNKQIIWNMNSALLNMAEEFLFYCSVKRDPFIKNHYIAEEYSRRKLSPFFLKKIDETESTLNENRIDQTYFMYKILLEASKEEYYRHEEKQNLSPSYNISEGEYSILLFLWKSIEVMNNMMVDSYMYNAAPQINIINEFIKNLQLENIIKYCKQKEYGYTWLIEMFYYQFKIIMYPDDIKSFYKLKQEIERNFKRFTDKEKLNWITTLMNFCGYKHDAESRKMLFEIHQFELKEGIALTGKYLSKPHYLQILKNAIAINKNEWVKDFIEKYIPKLKPSYQKQIKALSLAYLHLNLKQYEKVIESLAQVRFSDIKDKLTVKMIYIRTYYELDETEALISHVDTTSRFISNNIMLIPDDIAKKYRAALNVIKKLITVREKKSYDDLYVLKKAITEKKDAMLSEWLIEKIEEIQK